MCPLCEVRPGTVLLVLGDWSGMVCVECAADGDRP